MTDRKITITGNGPSCLGGKAKVMIDGVPMPKISRIELVADAKDGLWRAVIHVIPDAIDISDLGDTEMHWVSTDRPL